jgi:GTP diphosphokinase / guanosine-3',5'-bis(diphosphate) 3'-diphosphatase
MLAKAIALAAKVFENKKDKGGKPYILHCLWVMNNVDQNDQDLMTIAVLHDIIEDSVKDEKPITAETLIQMGFKPRVIIALDLLTHKKEVPYDDYIRALSHNPDARAVKMADLRHNSDITRLKSLRQKDFERMEKYQKSFVYLSH